MNPFGNIKTNNNSPDCPLSGVGGGEVDGILMAGPTMEVWPSLLPALLLDSRVPWPLHLDFLRVFGVLCATVSALGMGGDDLSPFLM